MNLKVTGNTVLVVDDTPSNLQVLFTYLENAGFMVLLAQNGNKALQIVDKITPDLILLDILMPHIDGFEVCHRLKSNKSTKQIPIIFITGLSETIHKVKGFAVGGVDYITKPIERQELIARIDTHLKLHNISQHLLQRNQELQQEIDFRQHIETKLEQTLDSEASIRRITEKIRDMLDENQVLQTITQELTAVLSLKGCQIEFGSSDRQVAIVNEKGEIKDYSAGITEQIAEYPQICWQLAQKISLQLVTEISIQLKHKVKERLTCLICPIFDNQDPINIIGNLWLLRPPGDCFQLWEIRLVEQIANQCAIAIRQARLYQTSRLQIEELAKLNRLKDDFLKTISHELRSPTGRIQLAVQTLEKLLTADNFEPHSATFQRVLKIFHQSCNKQNELIDNLLTLCNLDAKTEKIVVESIDFKTWIPQILNSFRQRITKQDQHLTIDIATDISRLQSDPFILEKIIQELMSNAIKYTPAEGKIIVEAQKLENTIQLKITNLGIEIPSSEQERIFERFYRIPNNDPWQYGGTGLGLYLVKRLIKLIKGKIIVSSQPQLTQFIVELPLSIAL